MSADEPSGPAGQDAGGQQGYGIGQRRDRRLLIRLMVGIVAVVLLVGSVTHIGPAVRAGLHLGVRGSWVATSLSCERKACTWNGKFVLPDGRVQLASAHYDGQIPGGVHAGTTIRALYPGGSGIVYPVTGSDQWISLLVALCVALVGLYWASRPWLAGYLRRRPSLSAPAPPG